MQCWVWHKENLIPKQPPTLPLDGKNQTTRNPKEKYPLPST